jgi:AcrR family transcriptional regulator
MTSLPAGLRERKKAKTRAAIREHALRLFEEQGYGATTVDQIAEAAEVSQSTFFRYFPAKEDVVLIDDFDPVVAQAIRAQPPDVPPLQALINGMREVFETMTEDDWALERRRQALYEIVPELKARAQQQTAAAVDMLAEVLSERDGKPAGDLTSRVVAGALVGMMLAIIPAGATSVDRNSFSKLDEGVRLLREALERG